MRKILSLIILVICINSAKAQIDTVYFRNMTFSWKEWKFLIGNWSIQDSVESNQFFKIKAVVDVTANLGNDPNITVDSLRGSLALKFYRIGQGTSRGASRTLPSNGNNIRTVIRAYLPMVTYCDAIDLTWDTQTDDQVKFGKFKLNKAN